MLAVQRPARRAWQRLDGEVRVVHHGMAVERCARRRARRRRALRCRRHVAAALHEAQRAARRHAASPRRHPHHVARRTGGGGELPRHRSVGTLSSLWLRACLRTDGLRDSACSCAARSRRHAARRVAMHRGPRAQPTPRPSAPRERHRVATARAACAAAEHACVGVALPAQPGAGRQLRAGGARGVSAFAARGRRAASLGRWRLLAERPESALPARRGRLPLVRCVPLAAAQRPHAPDGAATPPRGLRRCLWLSVVACCSRLNATRRAQMARAWCISCDCAALATAALSTAAATCAREAFSRTTRRAVARSSA